MSDVVEQVIQRHPEVKYEGIPEASPRRKEATAWSGGAELFGREDPGERAGGNDSDAVASGPDRRSDPGGLGTPPPRALILSRNSAWE